MRVVNEKITSVFNNLDAVQTSIGKGLSVNQATPVKDLAFVQSPNLKRAMKREEQRKELTEKDKQEIAQLDELIQLAMKACRKGSTVRGRRNPAFQNLQTLVKARKQILDGKNIPEEVVKKPTGLEELESILGKAN